MLHCLMRNRNKLPSRSFLSILVMTPMCSHYISASDHEKLRNTYYIEAKRLKVKKCEGKMNFYKKLKN
jgi:hypothetical protein